MPILWQRSCSIWSSHDPIAMTNRLLSLLSTMKNLKRMVRNFLNSFQRSSRSSVACSSWCVRSDFWRADGANTSQLQHTEPIKYLNSREVFGMGSQGLLDDDCSNVSDRYLACACHIKLSSGKRKTIKHVSNIERCTRAECFVWYRHLGVQQNHRHSMEIDTSLFVTMIIQDTLNFFFSRMNQKRYECSTIFHLGQ